MLHTLEWNYRMLCCHMNMFIWEGIILLFLIIFPLMVKFLLAAHKERCEDGACWYRRLEAAHGPLSVELVEEGPLEARRPFCVTLTACCQGFCIVYLQFWGSGEAVSAGLCCAAWGSCTPECGQVHFCGLSHWITSASLHPLPVPR